MSLSMYDVSVPLFRQVLTALAKVVDKAQAHSAAGALAEPDMIGGRLHESMLPFSFQIGQAISHSAGAVAKLSGGKYPYPQELETFEGCKEELAKALAFLDKVTTDSMAGAAEADVIVKVPGAQMSFDGQDYLLTYALPNFYFHATTAYDILRHQGLPIGKRDYLGAVKMKAAA
jgi:hypothetical protein